jgi:APA family basic amino acid/polyamine antiporter
MIVFVSLIVLRYKDPYSPRPYKMPVNVKIKSGGNIVDFPLLGILGFLGVSFILFEVIFTHAIGRIAGPAWVILCLVYYIFWRRRNKLPVLKSIKHNWEQEQIDVLTSAEEYDLVEEYKNALAQRDKKVKRDTAKATPTDKIHDNR